MTVILIIAAVIALVVYLYIRHNEKPKSDLLLYVLTAIITLGIALMGSSVYRGIGPPGSFGYEPSNPTLGIIIFIWALIVALSPLMLIKYRNLKVFVAILVAGALSILFISALLFLT